MVIVGSPRECDLADDAIIFSHIRRVDAVDDPLVVGIVGSWQIAWRIDRAILVGEEARIGPANGLIAVIQVVNVGAELVVVRS